MSIFNFLKSKVIKKEDIFQKIKTKLKYRGKLFLPVFLFILFISTASIITLANFGGGQTANTPNLQRGLIGHWTMDENSYVEGTENLINRDPDFNNIENNSSVIGGPGILSDDWSFNLFPNIDINPETGVYFDQTKGYLKKGSIRMEQRPGGNSETQLTYRGTPINLDPNKIYTASVYCKSTSAGRARLHFNMTNTEGVSGWGYASNSISASNQWERLDYTFTGVQRINTFRLQMTGNTHTNTSYWSAVQLEQKPYVTPFVEGIRKTRLADSTPYGNHGTSDIYNSPTLGTDRFGKEGGALEFNGSSYIEVPSFNELQGANEFTIGFWIKFNDPQDYVMWRDSGWLIEVRNSNYRFRFNLDGSWRTSFYMDHIIGEWHHVSVTWDGTNTRSYLNADIKINSTDDSSYNYMSNISDILNIAHRSTYFEGEIDDVRMYNRSLSQEEISLLYDSYKPQMQASSLNSGLVGHWTLDEDKYNPSNFRVIDNTPYKNHGTNHGATFTTDRFGKVGGAMSFNGNNIDYINTNLITVPENGTISGWIKGSTTSQKSQNIYPFGFNYVSLLGPSGGSNDSRSGIITGTSSDYDHLSWGGQNLYDNEWHNYVVTWEQGVIDDYIFNLYIDGNKIGSPKNSAKHPAGSLRNFRIGVAWGTYGAHTGLIDDVRLYNRTLSEKEISQLYNSYKPRIVVDAEPLLSMNCNPPETGTWNINDKVVCVNEDISIKEFAHINNGGELHLHNVTFNLDHPSTYQYVLRVYGGGKLYSNNVLFTSNVSGSRHQRIRVESNGEAYFNNTTLERVPSYIRFKNYGYAEINNSNFGYLAYFYNNSETVVKDSHIHDPYFYVPYNEETEINNLDRTNTNLTYDFTTNSGLKPLRVTNSHLRNFRILNQHGKLTVNNSNLYALYHYNYNSNQGTYVNNSNVFLKYYYAYQSGQTVTVEDVHGPLSSFTGKIAETTNDKNIHFDNSNITRLYYLSANGNFTMRDSTVYQFYGLTNSQNELDNVAITYRMYLYSNSINTIKNSDITNSDRTYIYNTSQTNLINSSIDSPNFRLYNTASVNSDTNSTLTRLRLTSGSPSISGYTNIDNFSSWSSGVVLTRELPFKVLNTSNNPVSGATVAIYDGGSLIDSGTSNASGKVNLTISADNSSNSDKQYEVRVNGQVAGSISILESSGPDGIELVGSW